MSVESQSIDPYDAVLADLRAKRDQIDQAIAAIESCTGADMAKFGNRYAKIAARVGKSGVVGEVLNEEQVRDIIK